MTITVRVSPAPFPLSLLTRSLFHDWKETPKRFRESWIVIEKEKVKKGWKTSSAFYSPSRIVYDNQTPGIQTVRRKLITRTASWWEKVQEAEDKRREKDFHERKGFDIFWAIINRETAVWMTFRISERISGRHVNEGQLQSPSAMKGTETKHDWRNSQLKHSFLLIFFCFSTQTSFSHQRAFAHSLWESVIKICFNSLTSRTQCDHKLVRGETSDELRRRWEATKLWLHDFFK